MRIKKASQPTPIPPEDGYSCNYINSTYCKETVLYNEPTNTSTNAIQLSDNISNYKYLEVYAKSNDGHFISTKIDTSNSNFSLQIIEGSSSTYYINIKCVVCTLNTDTISFSNPREVNINSSKSIYSVGNIYNKSCRT